MKLPFNQTGYVVAHLCKGGGVVIMGSSSSTRYHLRWILESHISFAEEGAMQFSPLYLELSRVMASRQGSECTTKRILLRLLYIIDQH